MPCFFLHRIVIRFTHNIVSRTSYRLADVAILILLTSTRQVKHFLSPAVVVCVTVSLYNVGISGPSNHQLRESGYLTLSPVVSINRYSIKWSQSVVSLLYGSVKLAAIWFRCLLPRFSVFPKGAVTSGKLSVGPGS